MPNYQGVERRRFVRIPFWFITKYRPYPFKSSSNIEFGSGVGRNISVGGICFEAEDDFRKDSVLEVELDMPALEHSIKVIGKVAWVKEKDDSRRDVYGLAFTKIKDKDIKAVNKIIETFS